MNLSKINPLKFVFLSSLFLWTSYVFAQDKKEDCQDVVYLKGGTILRGTIKEYSYGSDLLIQTWSGVQMRVPAAVVRRVVQKCREINNEKSETSSNAYSFEERGWYHATRLSALPGASGHGFGLQHSSGLKINRLAGVGLGVGIENFDLFDSNVPTYPIFAEVRGYLLARRITPFYDLAAGYGISHKTVRDATWVDGPIEYWRGGWMAQGHLGYRIGNHAFVQFGIRLQHKTRQWENSFRVGNSGTDQILHKRIDIGLGLLL